MEFLQNNNHQAVKKMEWIENRKNTKKYSQITVGIPYECLRVVVSVWMCVGVYACMCYSYVLMCLFMTLSQATNTAR